MEDIEHEGRASAGFGLAEIKTEGARIPYDPDATYRPRKRRWLPALRKRLRYLPDRVWWAFFGGTYYD